MAKLLKNVGRIVAVVAAAASLTLLLMFLAGFFHQKVVAHQGKVHDQSNAPLSAVRLIQKPRYETAVGTIKAVHEAAVASRLLSRVVEINAKASQPVQRDDVLLRLDDKELQARHKQAEAARASAKATLENASAEYERAKRLVSGRSIALQEFDRAATAFRTAQADVARSEQAVHEATALLAHATIRAPLTGIVIDKKVEVGDTVTPGQTLVTIFNPAKMQMLVSVRESLALKLRVGQKVPGRIESLDYEGEATISEIVPEAQATSRSFTVKVVGPCPPGVYSGMFGRIDIPLEDEEIIVVPAAAIRRVGQLEIIQVVEEGQLLRRNILTGRTIGADLEVLSGLRPGERVVLPANGTEVSR
jgi:RND family efflux transporter MFP subunit